MRKKLRRLRWLVKMVWWHGWHDAREINRINTEIRKDWDSTANDWRFEMLSLYRGNGWFGMKRD